MEGLTLVYNPSCTSIKDVKSKARCTPGVGFVFGGRVYHKNGDFKIVDEWKEQCFNRNNNDQIEEGIFGLLASFENSANITRYQLEVLSTNQTITVPHLPPLTDAEGIMSTNIFSISQKKKNDYYFDLCVYDMNNRALSFNKKDMGVFTHSGDVRRSELLLHTIKVKPDATSHPFFLSVTGYNKKPLHAFSAQTPSVCIVNHLTETVYIVPCPLDIMSMGYNNFAILVKGVVRETGIEYTVLPKPITRGGVNTGECNSDTWSAVRMAGSVGVVAAVTPDNDEDNELIMEFKEEEDELVRDCMPTTGPPVVVVQDKYSVPECLKTMDRYYFGTTVATEDKFSDIVLPIAGGSVVVGDNILVHAKEPLVENYSDILKAAKCVTIVVGGEMQNSLIDKCQSKVNALFVVLPDVNNKTSSVAEIMDNMCVSSVTAMAGPCAMVVASIQDRYYFYRGVDWPGFIEGAKYGDDVSEHINKTLLDLNTKTYPWPFYANMEEVYLNNTAVRVDQLLGMGDLFNDFTNVLHQLQVILSPEKLKSIQREIIKQMVREEKTTVLASPEVVHMIRQKQFGKIKDYVKRHRERYSVYLSALENAISLQKSSSRAHDISRLVRREAISANVEEAATLTAGDLIDELCTELGTISCLIDNQLLQSLFLYLKDGGKLVDWLKTQDSGYLTNVTNISSRMGVLDGTTTSALLLNDPSDTYLCPGLSVRNIYDETEKYESVMFLPLHDKKYQDPYAVSWPNETNDRKVALLRIKLRGIIASAIGRNVPPSSKEVGYTLIYLYFCILARFTKDVKPTADEDSSVRNISRAIISSILCVASSGQSPLPLYQIVSHNAPVSVPDSSTWWMYFKLRELWKYTGWDEGTIDRKFKLFLVRCIRKHVVDPVTDKLRKTGKKRRLLALNALHIKRNAELAWLKEVIPVILAGLTKPEPYPGEIVSRGSRIINKFLSQGKGAPNREYVLEVCNNIIKKRARNNWMIQVAATGGVETILKRFELGNIPERDQFKSTDGLRAVVKALYSNYMNIEQSEQDAIKCIDF